MLGRVTPVAPYRVALSNAAATRLTASGNVHGVIVKAICPGDVVYIGADANVTAANGHPLEDKASLDLELRNANQLWAITGAGAAAVSVLPYYRN